MKRARKKPAVVLTELEGCVLGMIGSGGPCTPYAIRRELRNSPSQYWSASAGAVYPLFIKMARQALVRAHRKIGDARGGTLYKLTSAGERAFREWLGPPCSSNVTNVPPDPLRNRVAFLSRLDREEQARFLADAVKRIRVHIVEMSSFTERTKTEGDRIEYLVCRGALDMLRARLEWLLETMRFLDLPTMDNSGS